MRISVCQVGSCGFEEWSREKKAMAPCGKRAVAIAGGMHLCREHAIHGAMRCTFGKNESPNEFVRSLARIEEEVEAEIRQGDRVAVAGLTGKVLEIRGEAAVIQFDSGSSECLSASIMKGAKRI